MQFKSFHWLAIMVYEQLYHALQKVVSHMHKFLRQYFYFIFVGFYILGAFLIKEL